MTMQAAYYLRKGPAAEVLQLGELEMPKPAPGEVGVRIKVSAVNPSDTKKSSWTSRQYPHALSLDHSASGRIRHH